MVDGRRTPLKVLNFRHIGLPVHDMENSMEFFNKLGFDVKESGQDVINGQHIKWVKMINDQGFIIELLSGGEAHLAFTVDEVEKKHYFFTAPSGHKVQFGFSPDRLPVEFVEEPG
jgi:catechol 2,3-dioxygenase-like lactoylglutathione lyase family enzyme